jgi:hypothetical protein
MRAACEKGVLNAYRGKQSFMCSRKQGTIPVASELDFMLNSCFDKIGRINKTCTII